MRTEVPGGILKQLPLILPHHLELACVEVGELTAYIVGRASDRGDEEDQHVAGSLALSVAKVDPVRGDFVDFSPFPCAGIPPLNRRTLSVSAEGIRDLIPAIAGVGPEADPHRRAAGLLHAGPLGGAIV